MGQRFSSRLRNSGPLFHGSNGCRFTTPREQMSTRFLADFTCLHSSSFVPSCKNVGVFAVRWLGEYIQRVLDSVPDEPTDRTTS